MNHISYQLALAHNDDLLRDAAGHRLVKQATDANERAPGKLSRRWRGRHGPGRPRVAPRTGCDARHTLA
jgi:hypothetical protein